MREVLDALIKEKRRTAAEIIASIVGCSKLADEEPQKNDADGSHVTQDENAGGAASALEPASHLSSMSAPAV